MECRGHGPSLPDRHRVGAFGSQDFDTFPDMGDLRSADKDHFKRRVLQSAFDIAHELPFANGAIDLPTVGVAANTYVESIEPGLRRIFDFVRKKDSSRACAEGWF